MITRAHLRSIAIATLLFGTPNLTLAATFQGPTQSPPSGNAPGVIWNVKNVSPAIQQDAEINIPGFKTNSASRDVFVSSTKAFRVDSSSGMSSYNVGNWGYGSGPQAFTYYINGDIQVSDFNPYTNPGTRGRISAQEFCFNPGGAGDCISDWASAGGAGFVLKAGDTMTGELQVQPSKSGAIGFYENIRSYLAPAANSSFTDLDGVESVIVVPNTSGVGGNSRAVTGSTSVNGATASVSNVFGVTGVAVVGGAGGTATNLFGGGFDSYPSTNGNSTNAVGVRGRFTTSQDFTTVTTAIGVSAVADNAAPTRSVSNLYGVDAYAKGRATTEISAINSVLDSTQSAPALQYGIDSTVNQSAGTPTSLYGIRSTLVRPGGSTAGTIANAYGVYGDVNTGITATNRYGVYGDTGTIGVGVYGNGATGVFGNGTSYGVRGTGSTYGALFQASGAGSIGLQSSGLAYGTYSTCTSANCYGGYFGTTAAGGNGVYGENTAASGYGGRFLGYYAVDATSNQVNGRAVNASVNQATGIAGKFTNSSSGYVVDLGSSATGIRSTGMIQSVVAGTDIAGMYSNTAGNTSANFANGSQYAAQFNGPVQFKSKAPTYTSLMTMFDNGQLVSYTPGSQNVAGDFAGRLRSGDNAEYGGLWVSNKAGVDLFVGQNLAISRGNTYNSIGFYAGGNWRLQAMDNGRIGIGTDTPDQLLSVNGGASKAGGGSWSAYSDARLKDVHADFTRGLDDILKISPVSYQYKKDNALKIPSDEEHIGVVAQELQKAIPEAVTKNDQGYYMVNNDPVIWASVNSIKQLKTENDELKSKVRSLEERLNKLEEKLK